MKKIIATKNAPAAIGPYSQAIEVTDAKRILFLSGQLPIDPVTGKIVAGGIKEQTLQSFKNINAVLTESGMDMGNIVKTTVYLSDIALFGEMNEVYAKQFKSDFPARCAYAVKSLPQNALVEIEAIALQ